MLMKWIDETAYSQEELSKTSPHKLEPRCWRIQSGKLSLLVHRLHGQPDKWFLTCRALNVQDLTLGASRIEYAREEALSRIRELADNLSGEARALIRDACV